MKITILATLLLGSGLLATPLAAQSVPTTINYQGRLTDNTPQQAPIDGVVSMRFEIYDGAMPLGSVRLWREPDCDACGLDLPVTKGIFSVLLGATNPIPPSLVATGSGRWLQIVVNASSTTPETLSPRQRLSSVAYALKAEGAVNSDTLAGLGPEAFQKPLSQPDCPMGFFFSSIAADGSVACNPPSSSGVKTVSPSGGLTASIVDVMLNIGTDSTIQRRIVPPVCGPNFVLAGIEADGTPSCSDGNGIIKPPLQLAAATYAPIILSSNLGTGPAGKFEQSPGATDPVVVVNGYSATPAIQATLPNASGATATIKAVQSTGSGAAIPGEGVAIWGDGKLGDGVYGNTASAALSVGGILGSATATTGSLASGVVGKSNGQYGSGVSGFALPGSTWSLNLPMGVRGDSFSGVGVAAFSNLSYGLYARSDSGTGIWVDSNTGEGLDATTHSASQAALRARNAATTPNGSAYGLWATTDNPTGTAIWGESTTSAGQSFGLSGTIQSSADGSAGVRGASAATSGLTYGVRGETASSAGVGVEGRSSASGTATAGVHGLHSPTGNQASLATQNQAVWAFAVSGTGVSATSQGSQGIVGSSQLSSGAAYGVTGTAASTSGWGVWGHATAASGTTYGVVGESESSAGAGVRAVGSGTSGTALQIETGAIRVVGAGNGTTTPVWKANNVSAACSSNYANLNNTIINNDPSAILFLQPTVLGCDGAIPIYGSCTTGLWAIYRSGGIAGCSFNVFAIVP